MLRIVGNDTKNFEKNQKIIFCSELSKTFRFLTTFLKKTGTCLLKATNICLYYFVSKKIFSTLSRFQLLDVIIMYLSTIILLSFHLFLNFEFIFFVMYLLYCYYAFIDYYIVILTTKLTNCQTSRNQISGAQLSGAQLSPTPYIPLLLNLNLSIYLLNF